MLLRGKPITEPGAIYIPTAIYRFPGGAAAAWRLICGGAGGLLCELGWKPLSVLEFTALPGILEDFWVPMLKETDTLLVGGDPLYLRHRVCHIPERNQQDPGHGPGSGTG